MAARKKKKEKLINLLPQKEFEKSLLGRILKWILTTFRVIVISVELVVIIGFLSRFYFDTQNSDLNDEIEQKEALIQAYSSFENEFKLTQEKLFIFSDLVSEKRNVLPIFQDVASQLPEDTMLVSFGKEREEYEIVAASISERSIAQFLVNLQSLPYFESVTLGQASASSTSSLINFTIRASSEAEEVLEGENKNGT